MNQVCMIKGAYFLEYQACLNILLRCNLSSANIQKYTDKSWKCINI